MMLIEADAGGERRIGTDADEHPPPLPVVDIEIILDDPAVGDLQMPAVRFTVAYCRHDARWFARLEDNHDSIRVCPFEIGIDKVIATTLRSLYHWDVALFRPLLQPALKLLGNVPEHMPAHRIKLPVGIEEADDAFGLLERLIKPFSRMRSKQRYCHRMLPLWCPQKEFMSSPQLILVSRIVLLILRPFAS